jgi:hypothetical protein
MVSAFVPAHPTFLSHGYAIFASFSSRRSCTSGCKYPAGVEQIVPTIAERMSLSFEVRSLHKGALAPRFGKSPTKTI